MPDLFDHLAEVEAIYRKAQLSQRKPTGPSATGFCLNCEEPLEDGHRWCDADCRDDFEKRMAANRQRIEG